MDSTVLISQRKRIEDRLPASDRTSRFKHSMNVEVSNDYFALAPGNFIARQVVYPPDPKSRFIRASTARLPAFLTATASRCQPRIIALELKCRHRGKGRRFRARCNQVEQKVHCPRKPHHRDRQ